MMREIERRGGIVHIDRNMPEEMAADFLDQVLSCPGCGDDSDHDESSFDPADTPIDQLLAGASIPRRFGGH